ncbi:DegV family protein [Ligilactobacillus acidipiscis]|jgi:DegV family protein with EDD domain|uniref:DegV family protein n=1 Tax=Ligilactobacillus acidipiscis TaxID=89059 RepID=UPI002FDACA2C
MKKIKVLTDSSVLLTPKEIEQYSITIVPLSVEVNGKNYIDGKNISRDELIEMLRVGSIPKTSQPSLGRFVEAFNELGKDGSQVVAILLSDVLSGTVSAAQQAADMTKTDVTVINSKSTDRGEAFQVLAAAEDAALGKTIEYIKLHCAEIYKRTTVHVLIDNLDCLVAGGRVSKMMGAVTKLVNIKVVAELKDKSLDVVSKGRNTKSWFKYCQKLKEQLKDKKLQALALPHVAADNSIMEKIKDIFLHDNPTADFIQELTSPIIMTHTGLKAIGLITLTEKPVIETEK